MIIYQIQHNSKPSIRYACAATVRSPQPRNNIIDRRQNMIEIGYHTGAAPRVQVGNDTADESV